MIKRLLFIVCLVLGVSILSTSVASAYSIISQDNVSVGSDQVVDGSVYAAGSTVQVDGTINGDLFCAGQVVEITGTVNGDVLCAAQQLRLKGTVNGDARVAGQTFNLDGQITGSLTAFAQTALLNQSGSVGRDLTLYAQSATLNSFVGRDFVGGSSTMSINSVVGGSVKVDVQSLTLGANAKVAGSVDYVSNTDANVQQGAQFGVLNRTEPAQHQANERSNQLGARVGSAFLWFLSALLIGGVIMLLFPALFERTAGIIRKQPWSALGLGLLGVFVLPILALLAVITVVGFPLAVVIVLAWLLLLCLSGIFGAYTLGRLIVGKTSPKLTNGWLRLGSLALGLFILAVLSILPVVNMITGLAAVLFGAGSLLFILRNKSAVSPAKGGQE